MFSRVFYHIKKIIIFIIKVIFYTALGLAIILLLFFIIWLLSYYFYYYILGQDLTHYCSDGISEKICRVQEKITYFAEQSKGYEDLFKESVMRGDVQQVQEEHRKAMVESQTNLSSEKRQLRILENIQAAGGKEVTVESVLGKRKY